MWVAFLLRLFCLEHRINPCLVAGAACLGCDATARLACSLLLFFPRWHPLPSPLRQPLRVLLPGIPSETQDFAFQQAQTGLPLSLDEMAPLEAPLALLGGRLGRAGAALQKGASTRQTTPCAAGQLRP